ncbi:MAG: hypothetical protein QXJ17_00580 [Nitrososphaeria archaeon]
MRNIVGIKRGYNKVFKELEGTRFYPIVGRCTGIPEILRGKPEEMISDAKKYKMIGAAGISLFAYRYVSSAEELMNKVIP